MKQFLFLFLCFCLIISVDAQGRPAFHPGWNLTVVAPSGMNLRASPTTGAKVLAKVPRGASVELQSDKSDDLTELKVDGIPGYWVKVTYNQTVGYMFSGYLAQLEPPTEPIDLNFRLVQSGDGRNSYEYDPNLNYYAIVREDSMFALRQVPVHFVGEQLNLLSTPNPQGAELFIGTKKTLTTGPLNPHQTYQRYGWDYGTLLTPGVNKVLNYDYQANSYEMIQVSGTVSSEGKPGFSELSGDPFWSPKITDYRVRYCHVGPEYEEEDGPRVQTIIDFKQDMYRPFHLLYYGDMDGDGITDMITEEETADYDLVQYLYLSSEAKAGDWVRRVARIVYWGGC